MRPCNPTRFTDEEIDAYEIKTHSQNGVDAISNMYLSPLTHSSASLLPFFREEVQD